MLLVLWEMVPGAWVGRGLPTDLSVFFPRRGQSWLARALRDKGSGFQELEFSGRRKPCPSRAGLSVRLKETQLSRARILCRAMRPISLTLSENASRWTQLKLGGAPRPDTGPGWEGLAIMRCLGLVLTALTGRRN